MRILTVVKRVPDSRETIKVKPDGSSIETAGLKFVCDPFDEFGVEQAVQLKEQRGDVEQIAAICAGPPAAVEALHHAVAMGADRAIHLVDETLPLYDELALASALAAAIRADEQGFDLILCGKQNIDNDAGELGPALAEHLGLPHVGAVTKLEIAADGAAIKAHRRIEGAEEIVELAPPALLTCEKGLVEPRFPALPKLMKARKHPIETVALGELPAAGERLASREIVKLAPPTARPPCTYLEGELDDMARELVRLLREEVKVI